MVFFSNSSKNPVLNQLYISRTIIMAVPKNIIQPLRAELLHFQLLWYLIIVL